MKKTVVSVLGCVIIVVLGLLLFIPNANAGLPEGDWRNGYRMGSKVHVAGFQIGQSSNINFELICCCIPSNQNTACNFSNQDQRC